MQRFRAWEPGVHCSCCNVRTWGTLYRLKCGNLEHSTQVQMMGRWSTVHRLQCGKLEFTTHVEMWKPGAQCKGSEHGNLEHSTQVQSMGSWRTVHPPDQSVGTRNTLHRFRAYLEHSAQVQIMGTWSIMHRLQCDNLEHTAQVAVWKPGTMCTGSERGNPEHRA